MNDREKIIRLENLVCTMAHGINENIRLINDAINEYNILVGYSISSSSNSSAINTENLTLSFVTAPPTPPPTPIPVSNSPNIPTPAATGEHTVDVEYKVQPSRFNFKN